METTIIYFKLAGKGDDSGSLLRHCCRRERAYMYVSELEDVLVHTFLGSQGLCNGDPSMVANFMVLVQSYLGV